MVGNDENVPDAGGIAGVTIGAPGKAFQIDLQERHGWACAVFPDLTIWSNGYGDVSDRAGLAKRVRMFDSGPSLENLSHLVENLAGHFAMIIQGDDWVCAAVDRVRSIPLAYAEDTSGWRIDGRPGRLRRTLNLSSKNTDLSAARALGMAGYTIDNAGLYPDIKLLEPGELVLFRDDVPPRHERYYCYRPWRGDKPEYDEAAASQTLAETLLALIDEMMSGLGDRLLVVPLSAGRDSRVIVSAARHLGYKNIKTFAYGLPGNHEAMTSRHIADALGYDWTFVPTSSSAMRDYYASEDWRSYLDFADTLQATPFVQDHRQIRSLKERGYIPDDAVIANGNSGDYISGAHIFPKTEQIAEDLSDERRISGVLDALSEKHFSLWQSLRTDENCAQIRRLLKQSIDRAGATFGQPKDDYGIYEYAEFQDRQCKYVIGGQRTYEHLEHEWRMPLWDTSLLDFFETMPREAKLNQRLYADTLERENWAGVWQDVPVNARTVKPNWIRPLRFLAKVVHAPLGKYAWHAFEKRYFGYWMELGGQSAIRSYAEVARDGRGARHGVAWLTEAYLAQHGLDYAGNAVASDGD